MWALIITAVYIIDTSTVDNSLFELLSKNRSVRDGGYNLSVIRLATDNKRNDLSFLFYPEKHIRREYLSTRSIFKCYMPEATSKQI